MIEFQFDILTKENFLSYAMKHYDNPGCQDLEEFEDDLKKIKYIKRLLNRYRQTGELKSNYILNHIKILCNVFGTVPAVRMLFFKLDDELFPLLKTFCEYLYIMPTAIYGIRSRTVFSSEIPIDRNVLNQMESIREN